MKLDIDLLPQAIETGIALAKAVQAVPDAEQRRLFEAALESADANQIGFMLCFLLANQAAKDGGDAVELLGELRSQGKGSLQ